MNNQIPFAPDGAYEPASPYPAGASSQFDSPRESLGVMSLLLRIWVVVLIMVPVYGTFWTLDGYLSLGTVEATGQYVALPFPITNICIVFFEGSAIAFYVKIMLTKRMRHDWLVYCILGLAALSITWSYDPGLTASRALKLMVPVTLGVSLAQLYPTRVVLRLMVIAMLVSSLASLFMALAVPHLGTSPASQHEGLAWRGAMVQKNGLGLISAMGMILALGTWRAKIVRWWLAVPTFLLTTLLVIKSGSATSIVAGGAAIVLTVPTLLIRDCPKHLRGLLLIIYLIVLISIAFAGYLASDTILQSLGRDTTLTGRTEIWAAVWDRIQMHPWRGYGWGFWVSDSPVKLRIWTEVGDTAAHSHNTWLDIWLQVGLFGLICAILITLRTFFKAMALSALTRSAEAPIFLAITLLMIIRSGAEVEFSDPMPAGLFFFPWAYLSMRAFGRSPKAAPQQQAPYRMPAGLMRA